METAACCCIKCLQSMCLDPMMKAIGYVLNVGDNVKDLKKAKDILNIDKGEVVAKIKAETEASQEVKPKDSAIKWVDNVAEVVKEANEIEADYGGRTVCIWGCLLNCWSGYWIGRGASEKIDEVNKLAKVPNPVTEKKVPVVLWQPSMPDAPTMEPYLDSVRSYLRDNKVGVVGIWGMGGVGKSFLFNKIHKDPLTSAGGYDYVIKIDEVSRKPNLKDLQDKIGKRLNLNLLAEKDVVSRANDINRFLEKKNFLLMLDDLWDDLSLEKLGVPQSAGNRTEPSNHKQHVVLTTRFENVCMRMDASLKIKVECLNKDAAWHLFQENLKNEVRIIIAHNTGVQRCAKTIAGKCGGLPLALKVIGLTMSSKTSLGEWQDAIDRLNNLQLSEMWSKPDDPFPLLKFSYDYLPDDATKKCFLSCAFWPKDFELKKDELIMCWMGQGLLDEFTEDSSFRAAYNRGHTILQDLIQASLFEPINYIDIFIIRINCVKMHDVVRDLALWIANENCRENKKKWLVQALVELEQVPEISKWEVAEKISLMGNEIQVLPQGTHCPQLNTLILSRNRIQCIPGAFLKDTPALSYLDASFNKPISTLPIEFDGLVLLRYLNLSGTKIKSLPEELGRLTRLEYLILERTPELVRIPTRLISRLIKLKFLNLYLSAYMDQEGTTESIMGELESVEGYKTLATSTSTLTNLQRLTNSSRVSLWSLSIEKLDGVTSLHLSRCLLRSPNTRQCLQKLRIMRCSDLEELVMSNGDVNEKDGLENLKILELTQLKILKKISWGVMLPGVLFPNLHSLKINRCNGLKNLNWVQQLRQLEELRISNCDEMEQVIADTWDVTEVASEINEEEGTIGFPNLKYLRLHNLPKLQVFCSDQMDFTNLESIFLDNCPKLKKLPFHSQITTNKFVNINIEGTWQWWEGRRMIV